MLVLGDRVRVEPTEAVLARLTAAQRRAEAAAPGLPRHAGLVTGLILAGQLLQALADAEMELAGRDRESQATADAMRLAMAFARAVTTSWRSGMTQADLPAPNAIRRLAVHRLPAMLRSKGCEGYDFYAVYPEAYADAAKSAGLGADSRVIGIRSIGTSLAAMVAAACGAGPPRTVRPIGHPFGRVLDLDGALGQGGGDIAVVDEGPGLSGSSFGAVADRLEAEGVDPRRIVFFPSHAGSPGPQASVGRRARWAAARRLPADFERSIRPRLEGWAQTLTGPLLEPAREISGGAWRNGRPLPIWGWQERRKFRLRSASGSWLMKFAGLGEAGAEKLERARGLHAAGFTPEPLGLAHGFLIERWIEDAQDVAAAPREALIERLGAYLAFRAGLPARQDDGADLEMLRQMTCSNLAEAGLPQPPVAHGWDRLQPRVRRVRTDGRLHAWEWLVAPDGRLLKADALDHCCAHDLVGAQDIAWDLAGAEAEFDLKAAEAERLRAIVARSAPVDPDLLRLMRWAYAAFQLGYWRMAADAASGEDAGLAQRQAEHYVAFARRIA